MMVTANHMCKDKTIPSNNYCKAFLNLLTKFANFEIHPNAFSTNDTQQEKSTTSSDSVYLGPIFSKQRNT